MVKNNGGKRQIFIAIICYIAVVGLNVWAGITAYSNFSNGIYADKSFSKGIIGILLSTCGNIVCVIIATVILVVYLKKKIKN